MSRKVLIVSLFMLSSAICFGQTETEKKFPLVIQFISYCCGVPDNTPILDYIACFKNNCKTKSITAYRIGPMGKEGEYYLAFPLTDFSKSQAKKFIEGIEKVKIKEGDQGGISIQKDFIVDSERYSKSLQVKENVLSL